MYHSVVKVKKIAVLSFSRLSFIVHLLICYHKVVLFVYKSSDMLNKNILIKKVRGQSETACKHAGMTISAEAKMPFY